VVRRVLAAREAWRDARSKQYYSLGEAANQYGNRHCRLIETEEGTLRLQLRVGHGRWAEMSLHYSHRFDPLLRQVACQGLKNTPRLMREGAAGNTGRG
jgi:urease accessory protein UreE